MVEVAGIEPASERHTQKASTCVCRFLVWSRRAPPTRISSWRFCS